jgi:urea transporter
MEKVKAFFKKVGSVIYDLFITSNRWMHFIVGGIIYVVMMAAIAIWTPYDPIPMQCCFGATLATLIAMCSKEYADKSHGGLFDWKDVLAGVTVPIVMDIAIVAMMLFR